MRTEGGGMQLAPNLAEGESKVEISTPRTEHPTPSDSRTRPLPALALALAHHDAGAGMSSTSPSRQVAHVIGPFAHPSPLQARL